MNIGRAFSFVFDDKQWVSKVLVGGLMLLACLTIVLIPFVVGYSLKVMGRSAKGEKEVLPQWSNWGELYKTGLVMIAISIIYSLILWVVLAIMKNLPVLKYFTWAIQIVYYFYTSVAVLFYAVSGKFEAAFAYGKIFKFASDNIVNLVIIWLLHFVLVIIALTGLIGIFICVVFTAFYAMLVRSYLFGELYRTAKTK